VKASAISSILFYNIIVKRYRGDNMPKIPNSVKRRVARSMANADADSSSMPKRKMVFGWDEGDLVEIRKPVVDRYGNYEKFPAGTLAIVLTAPFDFSGTPCVDVLINSTVVKNAKATDFIKYNDNEGE
jgi:hypothetical protein